MLNRLLGTDYCSTGFKKAWADFIDSFTDTLHARGPTVAPPIEPAQRVQIPSLLPAAERLVAVGDLHGDIDKAKQAFRLAGLIDHTERWVGGNTVVVQVGDLFDRGDHEVELLYWFERIAKDAKAKGGAVHVLNGNHEVMNVRGNFRYATQGGYYDFQRYHLQQKIAEHLKAHCGCSVDDTYLNAPSSMYRPAGDGSPNAHKKARWAAVQPGGKLTQRFLARYPVVLQVGSTVFVHGGLMPQHVEHGIDRINRETQDWMCGEDPAKMPAFLAGRDAVVWSRAYSMEDAKKCECDTLQAALKSVPGAKRMVVGHTIQEDGINAACDDQVYRVDVGMSKGCGDGDVEVLEILNDKEVRRLAPPKRMPESVLDILEVLRGAMERGGLVSGSSSVQKE